MRSLTALVALALLPVTAWSQATEILSIPVPPGGTFAGGALCFVPDANGDGLADILVGSPADSNAGTNAGRVTMFSGADGSVIFDVLGPMPNQQFGVDVDVLSDITGDGVAEVIVGPSCSTWPSCGGSSVVRVLDGATGTDVYSLLGVNVDFFGVSVAGIPDINGDGADDIIIAASDDNCAGTDSGRIFAYSGANGQLIYSDCSGVAWGRFGLLGIAGVGDLDGDGIGDWVAAACECPNGVKLPSRA